MGLQYGLAVLGRWRHDRRWARVRVEDAGPVLCAHEELNPITNCVPRAGHFFARACGYPVGAGIRANARPPGWRVEDETPWSPVATLRDTWFGSLPAKVRCHKCSCRSDQHRPVGGLHEASGGQQRQDLRVDTREYRASVEELRLGSLGPTGKWGVP